MLGLSLHSWEDVMLVSLGAAALAAVFVIVSTWVVVQLQRKESKEAAEKIATLNKHANDSAERIASLNNETARLQADNLALQTVMLPRRIPPHPQGPGVPEDMRQEFSGLRPFAGTLLVIQALDDREAKALANRLYLIITAFGWKVEFGDSKRTFVQDFLIPDGVRVLYPLEKYSNQPLTGDRLRWAQAAEALADALTKSSLAVGNRRVPHGGFVDQHMIAVAIPGGTAFTPPLEGVYLQVGARPVVEMIEWIKSGRRDGAGNSPTTAPSRPAK
jgi:hypothetical protein